jgi:D-alanine--D-alanine ligase
MIKSIIGLLCGGESMERGISVNSARSIMDHLHGDDIEIVPIYFDLKNQPHRISRSQLYSNTPDDFEFKLALSGKPLSRAALAKDLSVCSIVFPAIHGAFGEGGELQDLLEDLEIPYLGTKAAQCRIAFDKYKVRNVLRGAGYATLGAQVIEGPSVEELQNLEEFLSSHDSVVVKPCRSGSSIGVSVVSGLTAAKKAMAEIFSSGLDDRIIVEEHCSGAEFTVIVLQNAQNDPIALVPTEIRFDTDSKNQVFDFRKKYLPTNEVFFCTPPTFSPDTIARIRRKAEAVFTLLHLRDFVRIDGWLRKDGSVVFSDINIISGMEQNSFFFQQAAAVGLSHRELICYIVKTACRRRGISLDIENQGQEAKKDRTRVRVLFGGATSERQVSLMSGSNVWLKLLGSEFLEPIPYMLARSGCIWRLPYYLVLRHTVEEIEDACRIAGNAHPVLVRLAKEILVRLGLDQMISRALFLPESMSLGSFVSDKTPVFLALHGGAGEDGTIQRMLRDGDVIFSGSGPEACRIAMDKFETGKMLGALAGEGIYSAKRRLVKGVELEISESSDMKNWWQDLVSELESRSLIVKPNSDGCSSGVARLFDEEDLELYLKYMRSGETRIPAGCLKGQARILEMPAGRIDALLFEEFVETDKVSIVSGAVQWTKTTGWVEVTVGVLGHRGRMKALTPSVTVADSSILSLEEKFQGGTGVNITPPPEPYVKASAIESCKDKIQRAANVMGLDGFARIDAFMNTDTGEIIVIEINAIPGMTPSTVIFQQALAGDEILYPRDFLEAILRTSMDAAKKRGRLHGT